MKVIHVFFMILTGLSTAFCQDIYQDSIDKNEPEVKIDVQKEFDEDGNVTGYDSSYTWHWYDGGLIEEEMLEKLKDQMDQLRENMELFGDEFISGFYFDDELIERFREFNEDFKFDFNDSALYKGRFEEFFKNDQFEFHGFNFDGKNNIDKMPFDKEKIEEMEKRMKDLFDGEFDERIKKFIDEHKDEIDEIKYQIQESIPKGRKAI